MNKAVFQKVFSRCEDQHDIEIFESVLTQKIHQLNRPEEEKTFLIKLLGEVVEETARFV